MTSSAGSRPTTVIRATPIRFATAALGIALIGAAPMPGLHGQAVPSQAIQPVPRKPSAAIPATLPTSSPSRQSTEVPSERPAQHVDIQLADGNISVDALNASLNQVLREVGTKAGIKITGSVNDERVFGHYGPSPPSAILAALLDGTGANMLLVVDANGASELILTPRRGSPTPPDQNAEQEAINDEPETPSRYVPPIRPFQLPSPGRGPQAQLPGNPLTAQPGANQPGTDPNSARQIYDQMRNAQQSASQQQPPE